MTPVQSSALSAIDHDPQTGTLRVEFNSSPGKIYEYEGVPAEEYGALVAAESKGRHFLKHIKPKFKHRIAA